MTPIPTEHGILAQDYQRTATIHAAPVCAAVEFARPARRDAVQRRTSSCQRRQPSWTSAQRTPRPAEFESRTNTVADLRK